MIEQSNIERNTPLAIWDADGRPEAEKGARPRAPRPARFDDIKEEYSFRLKEYAVKQSNWSTQSSRYQNIWDWVRRTVEPALLAPHLELLVSQQRLSLQNVVRALRDKFQPSEDNTREQVREEYKKVLETGRGGSINPQVWINDWFQALARAQTYHVAEVEGFLAIKDFLQVVATKILPSWGSQQLTLAIEANTLGEPVRTLEQYGKIFEALVQQIEGASFSGIFASLGKQPTSDSQGYSCPCKETRAEKHSWQPVHCSTLELAITGSCERTLNPRPTDEQLRDIRERLEVKGYEKLRGQLENKGWIKKGGAGGAGAYPKGAFVC
jgi:hypothetical protein